MRTPSEAERHEEVCPDCDGAGDIETAEGWQECDWCGGTGMVNASEISVLIGPPIGPQLPPPGYKPLPRQRIGF